MEKKKWWLQKIVVPITAPEHQLVIDSSKEQVEIRDLNPQWLLVKQVLLKRTHQRNP